MDSGLVLRAPRNDKLVNWQQLALQQRNSAPLRYRRFGTELSMSFRSDDLVDDIMRTAPHTIRVFLAFRMACVGCPIATFHTVDDACREHGIDREKFLAALCDCVPA
ncbi:hybrid cluster protein-associated redox disulfide domain-containing protein [Bradyrhizobium sp. Rc2d]|nr:hybrid cluster protein-associated redox disulfide domain-containing protein [Bradyrhizobium sp. Rc2d]